MTPLIGITGRYDVGNPHLLLRQSYLDAVIRAGGLPVVLPLVPEDRIPELTSRLDGLILTGGEDVNPLFYGQDPHPALGLVDTKRDQFELALTRHWFTLERPLLGICRGVQVIQVAAGGALIQDIQSQWPNAIRHGNKGPRDNPVHKVTIQPDTLLSKLLGKNGVLDVNSIHHQAVGKMAANFRISAKAGDGVIEAIEAEGGLPFLGVQWHPEELMNHSSERLFAGFIALAQDRQTPSRRFVPLPQSPAPEGPVAGCDPQEREVLRAPSC